MVTVTLTNKQAAVLLKVIDSPSSVDPVLAAIYGKIEQALDAAKRKPGK